MNISQKLIDEGYVNKIKHPTEDLYLYNYTHKAQFEGLNSPVWQDYPEIGWCRGLILNGRNEVIARPFSKFWNYEQYANNGLPSYQGFEIFDKLDGSLGILYPHGWDNVRYDYRLLSIATRGSFQSEQAIWASDYIQEIKGYFIKDYLASSQFRKATFLFEIIYPSNRIVVDYKGQQELVLLSVIDNETGQDWVRSKIEAVAEKYNFSIVNKFDGITDFKEIRNIMPRDNAEGFVVLFDTGLRVKMKYEEYCRLHKLITGVSSKKIWEMLRHEIDFKEVLELVPDEFFDWVTKVKDELEQKFKSIDIEVLLACERLGKIEDLFDDPTEADKKEIRKRQATVIFRDYKPLSSAIFSCLDGKEHKDMIWKMLEPKYEQPFKTGVETE